MNYIKRIFILFVILIAATITHVFAAKGIVTDDGIRIRKGPSTDTAVLTTLNKSAGVEILEDTGDWYKIKYTETGSYEGYMSKKYIKKIDDEPVPTVSATATPTQAPTKTPTTTPTQVNTPTPTESQSPNPEQEPSKISLGEKVTKGTTSVYLLPTKSSTIKDSVKNNIKVTVQEIAGNYAYIKYNNSYGWVTISSFKEGTSSKERIGYINISEANIRKKASTSSELVTTLKLNTEVTIIGEEDDFYNIRLSDGKECYILKRLISDTKQQQTSRTSTTRQEPTTSTTNKTQVVASPAPVANTTTSNSSGEQIATMAKKYLGYRYVYGGSSPSTGFDCSGLVYYICGQLGYKVSRTADAQIYNGSAVNKANLKSGDLVFFSNNKTYSGIYHVGIYIGNNKFIHASTSSTGVITSSLGEAYYAKRYIGACRIGG